MDVTNQQSAQHALQADQLIRRMDRVPASRFHARVVGTLGAGTFFDAFDIVSIATVLGAVSATYRLTPSQAGLLVSAGFLGQAVGAIGFGLVSERLGRRRVFIAALLVMGVFALVSAASWSSTSLGAVRLVQGFGLGAEVPVASALLGEFVSSRQRGRITVLYKLASPLGNLAASLAAAALLASNSPQTAWRLLFTIGGAPLLVALVAWRLLPESPRVLIRQGRIAEAERIVTAMDSAAGSAASTPAPGDPAVDAPATPALAPSADLTRTRHGELLSPQYRRRTLTAWVLWFTVFFTLLGGIAWMPSLYVKRVGVSPAMAGLLSGAVNLATLVLICAIGATVDRVGRRRWFLAGYAISLTGALLAVVLAVTGNLHTWPALLISGGLMLLGVSGSDPLVYAYTAEIYPTRMRSWGTLSASSWRGFAAVLAPAVIGALVDHSIAAVFGLFAAVLLTGLVVTAVYGIETKQASLEELSQ